MNNINKRLDSYIKRYRQAVEEMEYFVNDLIISYEDIEVENIHNKNLLNTWPRMSWRC
jgi:hypothetical protein